MNQEALKIRNALSAVFYAENSSPDALQRELDTFFSILEGEKIEAVKTLVHWLNNFLYRIDQETRDPIIERISTTNLNNRFIVIAKKEVCCNNQSSLLGLS